MGSQAALIEYLQNSTKYTGPGGGMEMPGAVDGGGGPDFTGLYGMIGEGVRQSLAEKRKRAEIERALLSEQVVSAQRANQPREDEQANRMQWEPWQLEGAEATRRAAHVAPMYATTAGGVDRFYGGLRPSEVSALRTARAGQHLASGGDVEEESEWSRKASGQPGTPGFGPRVRARSQTKEGTVTEQY